MLSPLFYSAKSLCSNRNSTKAKLSVTAHKLTPRPLARAVQLICAGCLFSAPVLVPVAHAATQQEVRIQFDISAGPLSQALNQLSSQAGVFLSANGELTQGKQSAGLQGQYSVSQAFSRLLQGSDLTAVQTAADRYSLRVQAQPQTPRTPKELQAIEVIGTSGDKPFAETSFATTKTQTHILDIPQSVSSVNKEVIREHNLMRLNDIAPYVAGMNEFSVYDDLTIRGFRNQDDRRVNGMRTYNSFWTQSSIPHLERVEVIKGAAAATFGDSSPGGVINMVTKKPLQETQRELQMTLGSHDQRYLAADLTGSVNEDQTVLYRLNMAGEESDSFRNQISSEAKTVAPSLSFLPSDGTRINLDLVYTDQDTLADRGQPGILGSNILGTVPVELSLSQPGDRLDFEALTATISLEQELNQDWSLVLAYMHSSYDEKMIEHRVGGYESESVMKLRYNNRDRDAEVNTTSLYVTGLFETGELEHKLLVGTDYVHRDYDIINRSSRDAGTFDLLNPVYEYRDTDSYTLSTSEWGASQQTQAIYLQDQILFEDWEVLVGLRYDDFSQKGYDDDLKTDKQSDGQLSPRAGLVYKLDEDTSVYGAWVTGFEPQDPDSNFEEYGGPFDPSESELLEIGYKQQLMEGDLLVTAALYQLTQTNVVVSANDLNNPDLLVQRGEERSRGIELEANGQLTPDLSVIANYAWTDAEVSKDTDPANVGKKKENAPEHSATLWGRYRVNSQWAVGAGLSYVGERHTFQEGLKLPDYTVYNAGLYYTAKNLEVSLVGKNLTDKTHWTGGYNYTRVFPGDPRTFSLNMNYNF